MRKNVRPTKYPHEKIPDPHNTHKKTFRPTKAPWHNDMRPTRPTMTWDP